MENGWVERKSLCLTGFTVGSKVDWEKLGETHLGAGVSWRSWACKHCFQYLIPRQFWQFSSTLMLVTWLCTCRIKHTTHFDMKNLFVEVGRVVANWGFEKILTSSPFLSLCCFLACLLALLLLAHFFHLSALTEGLAGTGYPAEAWTYEPLIFNAYSWSSLYRTWQISCKFTDFSLKYFLNYFDVFQLQTWHNHNPSVHSSLKTCFHIL